ncbi:MAG: aspartate aminotransferase family protein [Nitrospirae bacterium]|nr:aspartate aminotransferase family protein [Nitrospirota bacterium]
MNELEKAHELYRKFVNPDLVRMLEALDYGRMFVRARGMELTDYTGRVYTDFLAGFGVHNIGHNHPRLIERLTASLADGQASMLNVDAPLSAGLLAERLTRLTHPALDRVSFANSGAEAVDTAVRAARAATGRQVILACDGGYHGQTTGTLPLMGDEKRRALAGPLPSWSAHIPFDDLDALEATCGKLKPAAFIVEPVQAEGGMRVPAEGYLKEASRICARHGCLLIIDEVQTGLGRTGRMFATDFADVIPDALVVGKALSGGMVPVAATLMTGDVWKRAFTGPERCTLTASTFAGGHLAMTAGLETIGIVEAERLPDNAREMGVRLAGLLDGLKRRHTVITDIHGEGLLVGIEFTRPEGVLSRAVPAWARDGLFTHVIAALLLRDHGIVSHSCTLSPNVLRAEPPLVACPEHVDRFTSTLDTVLTACPSFGSAAGSAFMKSVLGRPL